MSGSLHPRSMGGKFSVESERAVGATIHMIFGSGGDAPTATAVAPVVQEPATAMWVSG